MTATPPRPSPETRPTLLIVDDDALIADTLGFALGNDFDVYTCESRPHAIELLRQLPQAPQLALVDLGLPPTPHAPDEGFRLIGDLLAHSPGMRIFVLSGQNEAAHAVSVSLTSHLLAAKFDGDLILAESPSLLSPQADLVIPNVRSAARWLGAGWPPGSGFANFRAKGQLKWVNHIVQGIEETSLTRNPDLKSADAQPKAEVKEEIDANGKPFTYLPRLTPKDVYFLYNPDGYYRMR